jgi:hypothetical protein
LAIFFSTILNKKQNWKIKTLVPDDTFEGSGEFAVILVVWLDVKSDVKSDCKKERNVCTLI